MKYEKPEMEIVIYEKTQIFTVGVTSEGEGTPGGTVSPGSGTGEVTWG